MESVEGKLAVFTKEVVKEAKNQKEIIVKEVKKEVKNVLEAKEIEFLEQAYKSIQKRLRKIEKEKNENIASAHQKSKKELLKERERLIQSVFDEVLAKISSYCESENYEKYLENKLSEAGEYLKDAKLEILEKDKNIFDKITKKKKINIDYVFTDKDIIGGFLLLKDNIRIDATLFSKVIKNKEEFMKNTDLEVF